MDNPCWEWKIKDCSVPESRNKFKWIWNTGFGLGMKFVAAGIVVSSVPLVLPPLMMVSALGFAFSFPFGLYFASYVGTEKLMSKLLPAPAPFPTSADWTMSTGEEAPRDGQFAMQEGQQMGNVMQGAEMKIADLIRNEVGNVSEDDDYLGRFCRIEHQEESLRNMNMQDEGYVEDNEDSVEEEPVTRVSVTFRGLREAENIGSIKEEEPTTEGSSEEPLQDEVCGDITAIATYDEIVDGIQAEQFSLKRVKYNVSGSLGTTTEAEELDKLIRETRGLLEKIRYEGSAGNVSLGNEQLVKAVFALAEESNKGKKNFEKTEKVSENDLVSDSLRSKKPNKDINGGTEQRREETTSKINEEIDKRTLQKNVDARPEKITSIGETGNMLERTMNENHTDSIVEVGILESGTEREQIPVTVEKSLLEGSAYDKINGEKESVISSSFHDRGFNLSDNAGETCSGYETPEEFEQSSSYKCRLCVPCFRRKRMRRIM